MQITDIHKARVESRKKARIEVTREDLERKFKVGDIVEIFHQGLGKIIGYTDGPVEANGFNPGYIILTQTGLIMKRLIYEVYKPKR